MKNRVFELNGNSGYTFLIGTKSENPTNRDRERISRALAGVWEELFQGREWVPPYGIELIPDSSPPEGENDFPTFTPGKIYIVFVLLETLTPISEEREIEITQGIERVFRAGMGERKKNPRIGIVTLWNSSVSMLENEKVRTYPDWDSKGAARIYAGRGVKTRGV